MFAYGIAQQLQMQVVKIADQMERVIEVSALLLALLAQQVGDLHIPLQKYQFSVVGQLARRDQLRIYRLGAELQRPQQILQLPEVEDVFGDILLAFRLCYVHTAVKLLKNPFRRLYGSSTVSCERFGMRKVT